ncbi:MAG: MFS transporter [Alphaproteobacteria bacterium]|nr:MFS transporter [Alphaproteobacteria bacterium]
MTDETYSSPSASSGAQGPAQTPLSGRGPDRLTAGRLVFAFGFGFFLSMFTRAVASMIKDPVQADLMLSEGQIGLAMGAFFITFAILQLPVGIALDRYDPRRVNAGLMLLAAGGAVVFSIAEDQGGLVVGRAMMGAGFAGAMMSAFKTYALWFPGNRLATMNGIQFSIGVLGALSATRPTELALRIMDWRDIYLIFAGLTVLAATLLVTVAPRHNTEPHGQTLGQQIRGLGTVFSSRYFWRIVPWAVLAMGTSQALATLWVVPWLSDVAGFNRVEASNVFFTMNAVAFVNFMMLGFVADQVARRGFGPLTVPVVGLTLSMMVQVLLVFQIKDAVTLTWVLFSITTSSGTLVMPALANAFPVNMAGRVYTAFNVLPFVITFAMQWGIGEILDLFPPQPDGGASPEGYQWAFGLIVSLQAIAALWFVIATKKGWAELPKKELSDGG